MDNPTEKLKRYLSLESILLILNEAPRSGADKDEPEGSRIVRLSDTLCKKMVATIEAYINEGFGYLTHNKANSADAKSSAAD